MDKEQQKKILETAVRLGCFKDLDIIQPMNEIPKEITMSSKFVLQVTGRTSETTYHIYADPKEIVSTINGEKKGKWECIKLDEELKKIPSNTNGIEDKRKEEEVTKKIIDLDRKGELTDLEKVISDLELERQSQETTEQTLTGCTRAIMALYDNYLSVKSGAKLDMNKIKFLKDYAQKCLKTKQIKSKRFLAKIPLIGDKFEKQLSILLNVPQFDPNLGVFRLQENVEITNLIKKSLMEAKTKKENEFVKTQLVESRMKIILESLEKFQTFNLMKKVKVGFKTLREISQMNKLGLINENLGSLFKGMYGKSYESSINTISEPLFNVIFTKITVDDDLKNKILNNIHTKTAQLIASMDSCESLSKFLADVIIEEYAKKLDGEKQGNTDIVYSSFMDSVDDEMFRNNLINKIQSIICTLFEKFTENAKNLMVRMTAL